MTGISKAKQEPTTMQKLNVLDVFSGIGGFSLGLERAGGFVTVAFCECEPYAVQVLNKHWPDVPVFPDVRSLRLADIENAGLPHPDVICGGFPCQDISVAGKGDGLSGKRSSLWFDYLRLIDEIRPAFVVTENVAALRFRGLETMLRGLAQIGYDAEWHCIPASAVGAHHLRDRAWIIAYPAAKGEPLAGAAIAANRGDGEQLQMADTDREGPQRWDQGVLQKFAREWLSRARSASGVGQTWIVEPDLDRVADGVPCRVDRIKCLGNAAVPQIPEIIGHAIMRSVGLEQ